MWSWLRNRRKVIVIGTGGHARVVLDMIERVRVAGLVDDYFTGKKFLGFTVLGKIADLRSMYDYVIAIGDVNRRKEIYDRHPDLNYMTLVHPTAVVADTAIVEAGTVVCAGAIIQPYVHVGKHCIINTNCGIDHESHIGSFTNISPSVTICGNVNVGSLCTIGANSTIIERKKIGDACIIGAGSMIIRDVPSHVKIMNDTRWKSSTIAGN